MAFVSPIASGKEGWGTPTGSFRIISKDVNHQSGNFGLISDSYEESIQTRLRTPYTSRVSLMRPQLASRAERRAESVQ